MERQKFSHICAVAIIYRAADPRHLLLEMKDGGLPMKAFRWCLNTIGGNWIGNGAQEDLNPLATLGREIEEELTLSRTPVSSSELEALGLEGHDSYVTPRKDREVTPNDEAALGYVRNSIVSGLQTFGDFAITTPKSYLDKHDPENNRPGLTALASYFSAGLDEEAWGMLVRLQELYGNLSTESLSVVTTVDRIIADRQRTAFGHDRAVREFLITKGVRNAGNYPLIPEVGGDFLGHTMLPNYRSYLDRYEIERHPLQ